MRDASALVITTTTTTPIYKDDRKEPCDDVITPLYKDDRKKPRDDVITLLDKDDRKEPCDDVIKPLYKDDRKEPCDDLTSSRLYTRRQKIKLFLKDAWCQCHHHQHHHAAFIQRRQKGAMRWRHTWSKSSRRTAPAQGKWSNIFF